MDYGLTVAHPRPLVSYGKDYGRVFCFRTSPRKAWRYAEVEYANAGSSYGALALDCDDADAYARGFLRSEIPPPNWRVFRPDTGHSHAVWTLAAPVHKYPKARRGPLDYFAAIAEFYALTLGADPGYNGVLVHNPVSTPYETRWGPESPYPLEQLARVIPFGWRAPDVRQTGVGRNCDLFRAGMAWAGREANARLDVLAALLIVNQRFAHPLPLSEVRTTAREHREVPRAVDGARLARSALAGSASSAGAAFGARCGVSARLRNGNRGKLRTSHGGRGSTDRLKPELHSNPTQISGRKRALTFAGESVALEPTQISGSFRVPSSEFRKAKWPYGNVVIPQGFPSPVGGCCFRPSGRHFHRPGRGSGGGDSLRSRPGQRLRRPPLRSGPPGDLPARYGSEGDYSRPARVRRRRPLKAVSTSRQSHPMKRRHPSNLRPWLLQSHREPRNTTRFPSRPPQHTVVDQEPAGCPGSQARRSALGTQGRLIHKPCIHRPNRRVDGG